MDDELLIVIIFGLFSVIFYLEFYNNRENRKQIYNYIFSFYI